MGTGYLFDELVEKKTRSNKFDRDAAEYLKTIVQRRARFLRPVSVRYWIQHFTKLRKLDQVSEERIMAVLEWYEKHIRGTFVPTAYSAESFREKFPRIEDCMMRYYQSNPNITITDKGRRAAKEALKRKWPKASKDQILPVAQQSVDNLIRFSKNLARRPVFTDRMRKIVALIQRKIQDPVQFVSNWLIQVHKSIANWKEWSGNLTYYTLIPKEEHFQEMLIEWINEYVGNGLKTDSILETLNAD